MARKYVRMVARANVQPQQCKKMKKKKEEGKNKSERRRRRNSPEKTLCNYFYLITSLVRSPFLFKRHVPSGRRRSLLLNGFFFSFHIFKLNIAMEKTAGFFSVDFSTVVFFLDWSPTKARFISLHGYLLNISVE